MLFINTRTHVNLSERCHYGHRCPRLEETLIVYEERIAFATIFRQRSSCSVDVEVGFAERRELEIACRRHLIALIDVGMDVYVVGDEPPRMGGQVILSMPGAPCMTCLGFLNEATLAREAGAYGDAGPRPQVVWSNGVLASTAIGIAVDLLTDWTRAACRVRPSLPNVRWKCRHDHGAPPSGIPRRFPLPPLSAR